MEIDKTDIDINPNETNEWIESFKYIQQTFGNIRANFILENLKKEINHDNKNHQYINTIKKYNNNKSFNIEKKIENIIKWNSVMIVLNAIKKNTEIGGHLSTYISASTLYEVGFNHFWKGKNINNGDLIYIQGHSAPGIYARSFIEGRLKKKNIKNYRCETNKNGLSAYPHPWLMPRYWQFPTVSMGLGPLQAIYKAKFIHYLTNRKLINKQNNKRKIWCMCGDGEMDEPEALSAINLAGREKLNNLIFVINCNLLRLDGPVRGNSKIISELENIFNNAKWKVIKVIWNKNWNKLLKLDKNNKLKERMNDVVDGDYQAYKGLESQYMKQHFFNTDELQNLIKNYSDQQLKDLNYGGHDYEEIYHAYKQAASEKHKPVVILAKTVKGFGLGKYITAYNNSHSNKYMSEKNIIDFKNDLKIPISDKNAINLKFYRPKNNSKEISYIIKSRTKLGGFIPNRNTHSNIKLKIPNINIFSHILKKNTSSTIMNVVKIIFTLCKDKNIGKLIVPIVPDEARTFGMEYLFNEIKIYSKFGQKYKPIDSQQLIYYNESTSGQFLQEGINEAGAFSSWLAAATSYSTTNIITLPFYMFYSMFGFQRIGDLIWAAANARARGFLIGAISGKTSLPGEGLQHCDGNSQIISSLIPNCLSYDPAFNYELTTIIHHGINEMFKKQKDVFYYITTYNEKHDQNKINLNKNIKDKIIKGIYKYTKTKNYKNIKIELIGSGNILFEVIKAAKILKEKFNIESNIWSATSFTELARDGEKIKEQNKLNIKKIKKPFITKCFEKTTNPIIAVSDYSRIYIEQIREFIPNDLSTLTPNGFGISDSRENLKKYFKIDKYNIINLTLNILYKKNILSEKILKYIKIKKGNK